MILKIAIPTPLRRLFDYLPPENVAPEKTHVGARVLVSFGHQKLVGLIMEITESSTIDPAKLKPVINVLDPEPLLPKNILKLIKWTSDYYHHPIGDVVTNALPVLLREDNTNKKERACNKKAKKAVKTKLEPNIELNLDQQKAITEIKRHLNSFKIFLLNGVTGSGKTEVYLQIISAVINSGKQALILVPEINLTPQTIARFALRFAMPIAVIHSRLTNRERLRSWIDAKNGTAKIIIGTRSAIFTPLKNPGIIIIDEEHDSSFKQQAGLRYSVRNLANVRGKFEKIPVILGSATPSLESVYNAKREYYIELLLPERTGVALHPSFKLLDMRNKKIQDGIAEGLLHIIEQHRANKGQILLFINRRGYAPSLLCHGCSWSATCKNCDARMTLHYKQKQLHCHHCGVITRMPAKCPKCENTDLIALGVGTERVAENIQAAFPNASLVRIDRDTTRKKDSLQKMLIDIHSGTSEILVGTQMLAKGHHFPDVTLVAILNVDHGLFSTDFRASEHLAQLIIQVAGRAGRAEKPGVVCLQTHNPQHPLLLNLIHGGYQNFVDSALAERRLAQLPPFAHLAILRAESKEQDAALNFLRELRSKTEMRHGTIKNNTKISGPIPNQMERKAGYFRAQLLFQSTSRSELHKMLDILLDYIDTTKPARTIKWDLDVDPVIMD